MASERDKAKKAITDRKSDEPELDDALAQAALLRHQLAISQEKHRHDEVMQAAELGSLGRFLGGEVSASLTIAFMVVCAGLVGLIGSLVMAGASPPAAEFWAKQAERSGAI